MSIRKLILLGAGGHARSCLDVIEQENKFTVSGFVGTEKEKGSSCYGYEIVATDSELSDLIQKVQFAIVTIGQIRSADKRIELFQNALSFGFRFPTIVSPRAFVSRNAKLGSGTIVMHGATVNAGAKVGDNCIINTGSIVEHDVIVGDHCHISTGAILNGGVSVGDRSFIGSGSTIKEQTRIGNNCLIGMGVCVRRDIDHDAVFSG
ncbi:MAG: acetyltransferase [bacterium]